MAHVTPISVKGKPYIQVVGRVTLAHEDAGFSMLSSEVVEVADRYFVRVTIVVKDKQYIGTSEVKFGAKPGTADGDSPMECAETSALGRALGYAGYGSVESIASADEVMRNEQQRDQAAALHSLKLAAKSAGIASNAEEYATWKKSVLGQLIPDAKLTADMIATLQSAIDEFSQAIA